MASGARPDAVFLEHPIEHRQARPPFASISSTSSPRERSRGQIVGEADAAAIGSIGPVEDEHWIEPRWIPRREGRSCEDSLLPDAHPLIRRQIQRLSWFDVERHVPASAFRTVAARKCAGA